MLGRSSQSILSQWSSYARNMWDASRNRIYFDALAEVHHTDVEVNADNQLFNMSRCACRVLFIRYGASAPHMMKFIILLSKAHSIHRIWYAVIMQIAIINFEMGRWRRDPYFAFLSFSEWFESKKSKINYTHVRWRVPFRQPNVWWRFPSALNSFFSPKWI